MKRFPANLALGALCVALGACGGEPIEERGIAEVDGVVIRAGELTLRVDAAALDRPESERIDLLHEQLHRLVSERVILNRASEIGVQVPDSDIDARLRRLHGDDVVLEDPIYREAVRLEMTMERTALLDLADRAYVSETDLVIHFEENHDAYRVEETVEVRQIVVRERARALQLREKLKGGADFAELASEFSVAPEADNGGLLPPYARGEMPNTFDFAFGLTKGRVSKVLESPYGFHLLLVEKKTKARDPSFDEVRAEIALELERKKLDELRRDWLRGLQRSADIQVDERLLEIL